MMWNRDRTRNPDETVGWIGEVTICSGETGPVVLVELRGNVIYGRSLRRGEQDTGARIHVGPDDELCFAEGSITLEVDAINDVERQGRTGYVPVTPALCTWFHCGGSHNPRVRG